MRNGYAEVSTDSLVGADYNPNTMGKAELNALVDEVREKGRLMKPIVVRVCEGRHVTVDGHFNWAAARVVGLPTVPIEVIEADEFEARRQTLIRNRTGRKDNLLLGRVYRDMLAESGLSNRELGDILGLTEGSVRNQLLYPEAWDLLREKVGDRCTDAGQPLSTEAYVWQGRIYTEQASALETGAAAQPVGKLGVRDVRALVASLQGLADDDEDQPGAAAELPRILARLLRAWKMATEDERQKFEDLSGITEKIERLIQEARARGFDEGHDMAVKAGKARQPETREPVEVQPEPVAAATANGEARNSYAEPGARAFGVTAEELKALCKAAGVKYSEIADELNGWPNSARSVTMVLNGTTNSPGIAERLQQHLPAMLVRLRSTAEPGGEPRNGYAERGARIRAARQERGLTAKQLAERAGVHANIVSMAELARLTNSGGPATGRPAYEKLEAALGLTAEAKVV